MYTTQASLSVISVIVFVLIGLIIIAFIIAVFRYQHFVIRLRRAKIEAEITTLENERRRIAADIHDELGPLLSAAKLKYSEAEVSGKDDQQLIEEGHRFLDETVTKMRMIATDLMPTSLLYKGLMVAIKEFIDQIAAPGNLAIIFESSAAPLLSDTQTLHIYRILKEIIHNTLKHANASSLKIVMLMKGSDLIISTIDNGKGFNYKSMIKKGTGQGLYNVQSRTDILKGYVQVRSSVGKGTKFYISIPV